MTTTGDSWDVVIVGGGTAGLSAALILARARRRVLVLDSGEPRNRFAPHMHAVLGRDGYPPLDLVADGRREVRSADGVITDAAVASVTAMDAGKARFEVRTAAGERFRSSHLIIATGIRDELPSIPGLADLWGRGVVACPYCDGYEWRNRRIGVLLGSPAGQHKAQLLRSYSPEVTVFTALAGPLPEADSRALLARGVRIDSRAITSLTGDGGVLTGVLFDDGTHEALDVLFAEPRMMPRDEVLRQLGADRYETAFGSWTATAADFRTSIPGVFAIGNVTDPSALVPVAAAAGVKAAVAINAELVAADITAALTSPTPSPEMSHP